MKLLPHLLNRFVQNGRLTVIDHDGTRQSFGSGRDGPEVTIRFTDAKVEREIFFNPELKAAEAYMDGRLLFENGGTAYDLLYLFSVNRRGLGSHPRAAGAAARLESLAQRASGQPARPGSRERAQPLRSSGRILRPVARRAHGLFLRLLPIARINRWKMRRWRSSATSRRSSPSRPA